MGLGVDDENLKSQYWRFMFGFPILISLAQIICFWRVFRYDTPKFLLKNNMDNEAREIIEILYGEDNLDPAIKEISPNDSVSTIYEAEFDPPHKVPTGQLCRPPFRRALLIGIFLAIF